MDESANPPPGRQPSSRLRQTPKSEIGRLTQPMDAVDSAFQFRTSSQKLTFRYPALQRLCRPTSRNLWMLGGRPGQFKSQLLLNMALNSAEEHQRTLLVTLENSPAEVAEQALARYSGIDRSRIAEATSTEGPRFTELEARSFDDAVKRFVGLSMWFQIYGSADGGGTSLKSVMAAATRIRWGAIFIDHVGMIGREAIGNELTELATAIDRFRALSRGEVVEGYAPFICCATHLNRDADAEDRDGNLHFPGMRDFRGSSRIEADADVAMILRRSSGKIVRDDDGGYHIDEPESANGSAVQVKAYVVKNRNGRCPLVLNFEANATTCLVTERNKQDQPPRHWQEGDDE